jgi:hypothetical protein
MKGARMKTKLLGMLLMIPCLVRADNIKPLIISRVISPSGQLPGNFTVVVTTIHKDSKDPSYPDCPTIVDRASRGDIPTALNLQLKCPDKLTDLQAEAGINVTQMTGMLSQTIGAVGSAMQDPRAKAAGAAGALTVGALGILTDQGLKIAGKIMDKIYNKDGSLMTIVEILPARYYRIAGKKVNVTEAFNNDLETLLALQSQYQPAVQAYNAAALKYNKARNEYLVVSDDLSEEEENAKLDNLKVLKSSEDALARPMAEIQAKLSQLQLYRVALVAWNQDNIGTCGGVGSGPALLKLFVYLGAKQTNVYDIPYCVPNSGADIHADIEFVAPYFDGAGYHDGGVRLVSHLSNNKPEIYFQGLAVDGGVTFDNSSSDLYNLYKTMIMGEGEGIDQYLTPFDTLKLKADLEAAKQEAEAKGDTSTKEKLSSMLDEFKSAMEKVKEARETAKETSKSKDGESSVLGSLTELISEKKPSTEPAAAVHESGESGIESGVESGSAAAKSTAKHTPPSKRVPPIPTKKPTAESTSEHVIVEHEGEQSEF